jgi:hypothetical protein
VNALAKGLSPATPANEIAALAERVARIQRFRGKLNDARLPASCEAAQAQLIVRFFAVCRERLELQAAGRLTRLPEASQAAADGSYYTTAAKLCQGLEKILDSYAVSSNPAQNRIHRFWEETRIKR